MCCVLVFMLIRDFYQTSYVLNPLMMDSAGSESMENLGITALLMHIPQQKTRIKRKINFIWNLKPFSQCPKHDTKIVLGDFNAKVSKEGNNYPLAGRNGLHEVCNGNGNKLV